MKLRFAKILILPSALIMLADGFIGKLFEKYCPAARCMHADDGLSDEDVCKPSAVVPTRWFSFYQSATTTQRLWQHLLAFIDSPLSHGEKMNELQALLSASLVCTCRALAVVLLRTMPINCPSPPK